MAVSPVLVIKLVDNTSVGVRARLYDDFSEHEIVLNSVLTYWWANQLPPALKFLELLDSVIKRTINEIMPHKMLNLKYEVKANNTLEKASEIEIKLNDGFYEKVNKNINKHRMYEEFVEFVKIIENKNFDVGNKCLDHSFKVMNVLEKAINSMNKK